MNHHRLATTADGSPPPTGIGPQIDADATDALHWRRAAGVELLGRTRDSGIKDPSYLVRRGDDQIVQVSELLHLVLTELDGDRPATEVADRVTTAYGRTLTTAGLQHLVTTKLEPVGLATDARRADEELPAPRARPILALTAKGTLLPPRVTGWASAVLQHLYRVPVVLITITAFVAVDVVVFTQQQFWQSVTEIFATPTLMLAIYGLLVASAVVHELGHAAACRYGGATPGTIGFGLYIVYPAFYTDVTDSYRLGRAGRLRTDLGGLYFNLFCVIALGAAFLATGHGLFLVTLVLMQVQMLQQLIPLVRFDGYYALADLAGVPDLFSRVGPVLRSLRPGRPRERRVAELRPAARRLVVGWVLVVVPSLAAVLVWAAWHLPEFVDRARAGIEIHQSVFAAAWPARDVPAIALAVISISLILVPVAGIALVLVSLARNLYRLLFPHRPDGKGGAHAAARVPRSAADFTDDRMRSPRQPVPTIGWRRVVHRLSAGRVNPGPGPEQLRRESLRRRLQTPIEGSRRVAVMSRKGGVGKTTMALALGSTFAIERGDRVVAVDANPDAGNLAHRVGSVRDRSITHVLAEVDEIDTYARLRTFTTQSTESRLEVLASDDDPRTGMALDRSDYHRVISLLDHYYNLILLDTGTGILDSANQGLLAEADDLVLVLGPGLDGGRAAALTLDWMDEHGYTDLVAEAVVVVNGVRRGTEADTDPMIQHFQQRCAQVLTVPWDKHLAAGARTDLASLRPRTRHSLIEVAAAVADNFARKGVRR